MSDGRTRDLLYKILEGHKEISSTIKDLETSQVSFRAILDSFEGSLKELATLAACPENLVDAVKKVQCQRRRDSKECLENRLVIIVRPSGMESESETSLRANLV